MIRLLLDLNYTLPTIFFASGEATLSYLDAIHFHHENCRSVPSNYDPDDRYSIEVIY